ncbi:MAG: Cellobiose 2-epimerase [Syntrophorhabdus sp. PtaB.Bin047]|nr:MAG: Cellobiose 2-epimerase [Syntrophorhabdus sp. PtaB.Bin047]
MRSFNQTVTFLGDVGDVDVRGRSFKLRLRSGDDIDVSVGPETGCRVLSNLDGVDTDRVPEPQGGPAKDGVAYKIRKYVRQGDRIYVQGVFQRAGNRLHYTATRITLLHHKPGEFLFEQHTHWWLSQISVMADEWLQDLFGDSRDYRASDFSSLYRSNLNIYGGGTDEEIQLMATLSRFIYGLSSAYLLLGDRRYLDAARAGVDFQRTAFRSLSHDGRTILWSYGRKRLVHGTLTLVASRNPGEENTIPIYEQIYALAGLSQYFRITGDMEVLDDIKRTVRAFDTFFLDNGRSDSHLNRSKGYFSHIDPVTMDPGNDKLGQNKLQKNWNSIGDHIPAYLINVLLALDPVPRNACQEIEEFVADCKDMLDSLTRIIVEHFPDRTSPYVNERFDANWKPNHSWGWQQNRAIVGHNLKIAWNLTRVANYYMCQGRTKEAEAAMTVAKQLGNAMVKNGLDPLRGGCFDAVERNPGNHLPVEFVWGNHKDFWQQEQGILAYLVLFGYTHKRNYLNYYRDMSAWWNMFQLDRDNRGVFFRVNDNGDPFISGRGMAGSDIAGYHSFELNYLAHIYIRTYVTCPQTSEAHFCLYFRPSVKDNVQSLNVLPDFFRPDTLQIVGIKVNGAAREYVAHNRFQIPIEPEDLGKEVCVEFYSHRCRKGGA